MPIGWHAIIRFWTETSAPQRLPANLNGVVVVADGVELFPQFLALAEGHLDTDQFAAWLRAHCVPAARNKVQEPGAMYARRLPGAGSKPTPG